MLRRMTKLNAPKGQNHQRRATPCDWITEPFSSPERATAVSAYALSGLKIFVCVRFIGRCPMLMQKGFQPSLIQSGCVT